MFGFRVANQAHALRFHGAQGKRRDQNRKNKAEYELQLVVSGAGI